MEFGKKHVLIWGSVFLLLVALILAIRQLYIMFAVLALLAPISFLLSRDTLNALEVRRSAPGLMKEGEQRPVRLTITNAGVRRRYFFLISDGLPDGLEAVADGEALVLSLAADEEHTFEYVLRANRRGVYQIGPVKLRHSDLIGMFDFDRELGETDELVVHPTPERLPQVWTPVASLRAPQRPRRRFRGQGTEFYGTRPFVPGDDLRRVDWNATARRGQLIVREYERAEATDTTIVLDLQRTEHRGEGNGATVERAVKLAASVAAQLLERGSSVGLIAAGEKEHSVPPSAEPRQRVKLFDALARVKPDASAGLAETLAAHLQYLPSGAMVIVISPRRDGEALETAEQLQQRGHPTGWMIVEAPGEPTPAPDAMEADALAARLAERGTIAWVIEPNRELATSMRRARRAR